MLSDGGLQDGWAEIWVIQLLCRPNIPALERGNSETWLSHLVFALHPTDPDIVLVWLPCSFLSTWDMRERKKNIQVCSPFVFLCRIKWKFALQWEAVYPHKGYKRYRARPDRAYLAVEHLISRNAVQLHAEKVIPGESKRGRCGKSGSLPTQRYPRLQGKQDTELRKPWKPASQRYSIHMRAGLGRVGGGADSDSCWLFLDQFQTVRIHTKYQYFYYVWNHLSFTSI